MTDCYELGKHSIEITPEMNHWKRVSLVVFERKKNKNNKKIIPMYFAIVSEYTFSVFYKYMNKYLFYIK